MKIGIISFSAAGERLSELLAEGLKREFEKESEIDLEITAVCKSGYAKEPMEQSHHDWTRDRFCDSDGIIFIGASGIAVRSIAPYVKSKKTDPAVVAIDDKGQFAVPLLSGHIGGANELARKAADITGAVPVITTATDIHGKLAPDIFAQRNNCIIENFETSKEIAAALLAGERIGLVSDFPVDKTKGFPSQIQLFEAKKGDIDSGGKAHMNDAGLPDKGIVISAGSDRKDCFKKTLRLIPKETYLGIGCKRGTPEEKISRGVTDALEAAGLDESSLCCAATIDLKKDEAGLIDFCRKNRWELKVYTAEELSRAAGNFSSSDFVKEITGVDNVCERSAMLAAQQDEREDLSYENDEPVLLLRKFCKEGVTCAIAVRKWRISFE